MQTSDTSCVSHLLRDPPFHRSQSSASAFMSAGGLPISAITEALGLKLCPQLIDIPPEVAP
jgi:hypothetical protein